MWLFNVGDICTKLFISQNHIILQYLQALKWDLYPISETNPYFWPVLP